MADVADVRDNPAQGRYEMAAGSGLAVAYYQRKCDLLLLTHTEVPMNMRGRGVAAALMKGTLDDVRARGLRVVPVCSYVQSFIDRHPNYLDLLA